MRKMWVVMMEFFGVEVNSEDRMGLESVSDPSRNVGNLPLC